MTVGRDDADTPCRADPDLWYSDDPDAAREATRVCCGCPLATACLEAALDIERGLVASRRHGVWGGLTPHQRAAMDQSRHSRRGGSKPLKACRSGHTWTEDTTSWSADGSRRTCLQCIRDRRAAQRAAVA